MAVYNSKNTINSCIWFDTKLLYCFTHWPNFSNKEGYDFKNYFQIRWLKVAFHWHATLEYQTQTQTHIWLSSSTTKPRIDLMKNRSAFSKKSKFITIFQYYLNSSTLAAWRVSHIDPSFSGVRIIEVCVRLCRN